jgi:hypothetical protein
VRREDRAPHPNENPLSTPLDCGLECSLKILETSDVEGLKLHPECSGGEIDLF